MSLEAQTDAIDNLHIIDCAGKEALGGGVAVGLTATLLDALLKFEDRAGPAWTLCNVSGGNLVALKNDLVTYYPSPIEAATFVNTNTTASSSATQVSQEQLEHSTFKDGVTIDVVNGVSGTEYPIGTNGAPSGNLTEALEIAHARGFTNVYIRGNLTFVDESVGTHSHIFIGESRTISTITVNPLAVVTNAQFHDATLEGTLDGGSTIEDCDINDLDYVNGKVLRCGLKGKITLGGNTDASVVDSWSEVAGGAATPEIDMGGTGNTLVIRGYSGGIELSNCTDVLNNTSVDLDSGQIRLASTLSAGQFTVRGIGKVTDNSTGTSIIYDETIKDHTSELTVILDAITEVRKYSTNRTLVNESNFTLTIFDDNGTSPLKVFDLKDSNGVASYAEIFERLPQ